MQFASTGALANALIYFTSTGDLFASPESSTSVNQKFVVADRYGVAYRGIDLEPARVSGVSTGPLITIADPPGSFTPIWYGGIFYSDLVTNGADYVYVTGSSSGGPPSGPTPTIFSLGVDPDIDLGLAPKGAGLVNFNVVTAALGGGAAATLGTIGGNGPGVAGQAGWVPIRLGASTARYFLAVWST